MNAMLQPVEDDWFEVADRCWCGGHSDAPSPYSIHYRVCARCGAHFANRRLKPDCIGKFYSYEGYWQQRQQSKQHPTLWERQQLLETDGRVQYWLNCIARHVGPTPGTVVEVGCAEGTLLLHLRQLGWQTVGIEPAVETASGVRARTGLDVRAGVFPEVAAPTCDLFIACDVLEHVPEPLSFLRAARAALRPGGILFLQLPLIEKTQPDFGPMNDKVFDPQEHVFIYSREALATLLETAEFEVLENHDAWRRAHEIVVARRIERPRRKVRHLANLPEMFSPAWTGFIDELNTFAAPLGLRQFTASAHSNGAASACSTLVPNNPLSLGGSPQKVPRSR
jgi:SAM-dependent methyltransferase